MDIEKEVVVAISGYFDPLHVGHLELMQKAKSLGNVLVVILNNDKQCILKKDKPFMPESERKEILENLRLVDFVVLSKDEDRTVCKSLEFVRPDIFANGGDRHQGEIPEAEICRQLNIKMVDGLGDKIQSSSKLVNKNGE